MLTVKRPLFSDPLTYFSKIQYVSKSSLYSHSATMHKLLTGRRPKQRTTDRKSTVEGPKPEILRSKSPQEIKHHRPLDQDATDQETTDQRTSHGNMSTITKAAPQKDQISDAHAQPQAPKRTNQPKHAQNSHPPVYTNLQDRTYQYTHQIHIKPQSNHQEKEQTLNQTATNNRSNMSKQEEILRQKLGELLALHGELKRTCIAKDDEIRSLKRKISEYKDMHDNNSKITEKYRLMSEEQKVELEVNRRLIDSMQNNNEVHTKELIIQELEAKIERLEQQTATQLPPTPESTQAGCPGEGTSSGEERELTKDNNQQGHNRARRNKIMAGIEGIKIISLKFRTQGAMFRVKSNSSTEEGSEHYAEDVAAKYEQETRAYLEKLKEVKSKQISSIKKKKLDYLLKLM